MCWFAFADYFVLRLLGHDCRIAAGFALAQPLNALWLEMWPSSAVSEKC
jgi:hypothetical protein